jgi:hypothetical protein
MTSIMCLVFFGRTRTTSEGVVDWESKSSLPCEPRSDDQMWGLLRRVRLQEA